MNVRLEQDEQDEMAEAILMRLNVLTRLLEDVQAPTTRTRIRAKLKALRAAAKKLEVQV